MKRNWTMVSAMIKSIRMMLCAAALVCLIGSILLGEFAFSILGHDCGCTETKYLGSVCADQCISIGGLSVSESTGKAVLAFVITLAGSTAAGWLAQRADGNEALGGD